MRSARKYTINAWRTLVLLGFFWMATILGNIREDIASLRAGETIVIISEQQLSEKAERFEEDKLNRRAVMKEDPWLSL
jgi:hypothetical protein